MTAPPKTGLPTRIKSVADLHAYLHAAMQLEHATIPPYLMALYSIMPGTNPDATHIIRVVVVEEMLHLTLAANLLNAVGGTPDLTAAGFVPTYPATLPDGEHDFTVSIQPFSTAAIETFLKIERPEKAAPTEAKRIRPRPRHAGTLLATVPGDEGMCFYSIGEFYEEIRRGLHHLHGEMGDKLFGGDPKRQVGPAYYYSGGGEITEVVDLGSADKAISLIIEQGEGLGGKIYDVEHELAHFYRFQQLKLGRYYETGDHAGAPSGPPVDVDWDAVYRFKTDAKLADYVATPDLHAAAEAFNQAYGAFLALLTQAFNGAPDKLIQAVPEMFALRRKIEQLIHNPLPGSGGLNAAPTFEIAPAAKAAPTPVAP